MPLPDGNWPRLVVCPEWRAPKMGRIKVPCVVTTPGHMRCVQDLDKQSNQNIRGGLAPALLSSKVICQIYTPSPISESKTYLGSDRYSNNAFPRLTVVLPKPCNHGCLQLPECFCASGPPLAYLVAEWIGTVDSRIFQGGRGTVGLW